jgi:uncharacterized membrane protein YeaQ/YmgE (transglycosylase-associated protein family)
MLTVPWFVVALYLAAYAIAGMAIGTVTGWVTSQMTKCTRHGIWKDASLGSLGFLAGFIGCMLMPWPTNTVVKQLEGGGSVVTTMSRYYQHPLPVAVFLAILFPVFHELYRWEKLGTA